MEHWLDVSTLFATLSHPVRLSILFAVMEEAPIRQIELSNKLGFPSQGHMTPHLTKLEECGLVVREASNGRNVCYHPTPATAQLRALLQTSLALAQELKKQEGALGNT